MRQILSILKRIHLTMLTAQTAGTRLWLGATSVLMGCVATFAYIPHHTNFEYSLMSTFLPLHVWGNLFLLNGFSLLYGVLYRKANSFLLFSESILGMALWWVTAASFSFEQRIVSPMWICALVSFWLLTRYPTKAERISNGE